MKTGILISELDVEQLKLIISECITEQMQVALKTQESTVNNEHFLTRKEAAIFLHLSLPTLADRTKDGTLNSYRIGNRILYKKSELETMVITRKFAKR